MENLKPCPFCGGEAYIGHSTDNRKRPYVICKFGCFNKPPCPMGQPYAWNYETEEAAIEAWNGRANELDQR